MKSIITAVIPNYNNSKYLKDCINSVIRQTFHPINIIVIDDGSTDNSKQILESFTNNKNLTIVKLSRNKGVSFCRNLAIRMCKTKYVAFLDSDDIWTEDKIEHQLNFMISKNYDFTYTDYYSFTKSLNKSEILKNTKTKDYFDFQRFIKDTSIGTSTVVISKKAIGLTKFKNLEIMEDYLFKCQILKKGFKAFKYGEKTFVGYRITKGSRNSFILKNIRNLWSINKNYNNLNFFQNLKSIILIAVNSIKKYGFKKY